MNTENVEVRRITEIMQKYYSRVGDESNILVSSKNKNYWSLCRKPIWDWVTYDYKIVEILKYVPYSCDNVNDLMNLLGRSVINMNDCSKTHINELSINSKGDIKIYVDNEVDGFTQYNFFYWFKFTDGKPCGNLKK